MLHVKQSVKLDWNWILNFLYEGMSLWRYVSMKTYFVSMKSFIETRYVSMKSSTEDYFFYWALFFFFFFFLSEATFIQENLLNSEQWEPMGSEPHPSPSHFPSPELSLTEALLSSLFFLCPILPLSLVLADQNWNFQSLGFSSYSDQWAWSTCKRTRNTVFGYGNKLAIMVVLRATQRNKLLSLSFIQSLQIFFAKKKSGLEKNKKNGQDEKRKMPLSVIFSLTIMIYYICGITFKDESTVSIRYIHTPPDPAFHLPGR